MSNDYKDDHYRRIVMRNRMIHDAIVRQESVGQVRHTHRKVNSNGTVTQVETNKDDASVVTKEVPNPFQLLGSLKNQMAHALADLPVAPEPTGEETSESPPPSMDVDAMASAPLPSPAGGRGAGERVSVKTTETNFKHIGHPFDDVLEGGALATTLSPAPLPPAGEGSGALANLGGGLRSSGEETSEPIPAQNSASKEEPKADPTKDQARAEALPMTGREQVPLPKEGSPKPIPVQSSTPKEELETAPAQAEPSKQRKADTLGGYQGTASTGALSQGPSQDETVKEKMKEAVLAQIGLLGKEMDGAAPKKGVKDKDGVQGAQEDSEKDERDTHSLEKDIAPIILLQENDTKPMAPITGILPAISQSAGATTAAQDAPVVTHDASRLHQFVSELSKLLSIQGSTAEIALNTAIKGFPSTVVSLQQQNGALSFSCRCETENETEWFAEHAKTITRRLAGRLRRPVKFSVNGQAPLLGVGQDDDE